MALPSIQSYDLPEEHEIPRPRVDWRLEPSRAALLVHDLQGYFVRAFPADAPPMPAVLRNAASLVEAARAHGVPVYFTAQPGRQPRERRGLQADMWGAGMSDAPADRDIVAAVAPAPTDVVLTKWRYSAFLKSDFEARLRAQRRDQLIVTGVFAHIGCLLTAADAFMRDVEPFVAADAVADFTREHHDRALAYVAGCCGVALSTSAILASLS